MLLYATSNILSRKILSRISLPVDPLLRKERAGFRRGWSLTHTQIVEQASENNEWNSPVYVKMSPGSLIGSIPPALWKILNHYRIPDKLISIKKTMYKDFFCLDLIRMHPDYIKRFGMRWNPPGRRRRLRETWK